MRKFLLVAGVSAIALVGLSANQCSGDKPPEQAPADGASEAGVR